VASIDNRERDRPNPIVRVEVPAITIGAAVTTEVTGTVNINMTIKVIVVRIGIATNGDETYTLSIRDDNGAEHVLEALLPDATKTVLLSTKASPDFPEVSLNGTITVGITPTGAPGSGGVDAEVDLFGV